MQYSSSMKLSCVACASDSSAFELRQAQRTKEFPIIGMLAVGTAFLVATCGLLLSAFGAAAEPEIGILDCVSTADSVGSETLQTILLFSLGYFCCLAVRRRGDMTRHAYGMLCKINHFIASLCSACSSITTMCGNLHTSCLSFQQQVTKGIMAIVMAAILCTVCIVSLLIAAFTAVPDQDPTDSTLYSESSTGMRVFTVGWMFILSFKLRRELVGHMGNCCLLQPW